MGTNVLSDKYIRINLTRGDNGKFGFTSGRFDLGIVIIAVAPGGQAETQGNLQVGDTIMEIDQKSTTRLTTRDFYKLLENMGASVTLRVMRAGNI